MFGLEMSTFGFDDAFPEAIVRSFRKGFLHDDTYH